VVRGHERPLDHYARRAPVPLRPIAISASEYALGRNLGAGKTIKE